MAELVADVEQDDRHLRYRDAVYAQVSGFRPLTLDLDVPLAAAPVALVVYLHGGGFAGGTHKVMRDPLGCQVSQVMAARGIAVASVGYRLSAEARFPSQVHDVKAAVRWLRHHCGQLRIDPRRIGAWGVSAGGYLAAMLAVTQGHPELDGRVGITSENSGISAGVSWYGPANLATQPRLGPSTSSNTDPSASPEAKLLGAAVETVPGLAAYASPVTHASPRSAPMLLVHGDRDRSVPLAQSEELLVAYQQAGAAAELAIVADGDHGFHSTDITPLLHTSAEFLSRHLTRPG
jgi:acetyl esterase/lipase